MGLVGKYIDALRDEQRDRIIEGEDFGDGWYYVNPDNTSCRCLVGHAEDWSIDHWGVAVRGVWSPVSIGPCVRFPSLADRFGIDRIVRMCKARAAKGNAPAGRTVFLYGSSLLANDGSLGGAQPQGRRPVTSWVKAAKEVVKP